MPDVIACLNFKTDMNWGYIEGFRRAADIVAKQIIEENKNPDYLIYPLGFLYHQHIELQLKWLFELAGSLSNDFKEAPHKHDLMELWTMLKPKLLFLEPEGADFLEKLEKALVQICSIDHRGEQFRFQFRKSGKVSLEGMREISVQDFALQRISVSDDLQAIRDSLTVRKERNDELLYWKSYREE